MGRRRRRRRSRSRRGHDNGTGTRSTGTGKMPRWRGHMSFTAVMRTRRREKAEAES